MNFTVATPQVSAVVNDPASVDAAISSRFSARAYLDPRVLLTPGILPSRPPVQNAESAGVR